MILAFPWCGEHTVNMKVTGFHNRYIGQIPGTIMCDKLDGDAYIVFFPPLSLRQGAVSPHGVAMWIYVSAQKNMNIKYRLYSFIHLMVSELCTTIGKSWSWQRPLECVQYVSGWRRFIQDQISALCFLPLRTMLNCLLHTEIVTGPGVTIQQCVQTSVRSKNDFRLFNIQLWF